MGLSSKSQKSSNKPVFSKEITGAAGDITNAYRAQQPKITGITDQLAGLVPNLVSQYQQGNPGVNAASAYGQDVLAGKYLNGSPELDAIATRAGADARNQTAAALGTRGLTGGSSFGDIISRNVADASQTLRFNNYNAERGRMDTAASQAPALAAASQIPLSSLLSILQAQSAPVATATGAGAGIGGLLGQYQNSKQTYNPSLMDNIGQAFDIGKTIAGFFPGK